MSLIPKKNSSDWTDMYDFDWYEVNSKNQWFSCCDCGSTHRMEFKLRDWKIYMRGYKLDKTTNNIRKKYKIKLDRGQY